jgi:carbamoyltransferase
MLVTSNVKDEWKSKIPAVTHIDGTSRYQSVDSSMNERYHKLISSFYSKTGIPLVLNTSFNGPDEPIVETPQDAINTFLRQGLHYLVIDNFLIFKINN